MPGRDRNDSRTGDEVGELQQDVRRLEHRVDNHDEHIGDLRENHARLDGELRHLVRAYERTAETTTRQLEAELEVRKADALAKIQERGLELKARRQIRKELAFKLIAILVGLWGVVAAWLSSR